MNNAEQGSVQTEDCYCVLVYSFWKHNQIDMDRAQKACMVISCWKGVKIHCRSQNNTFQSLHRICSSAHKEETKKRSWCFSKAEAGSSWLCSLCRLDFSGCAQAAVAAGAGCCRITDHRTHPEQLWHAPFTLHAWEKSCQNYKKMIYIYIFFLTRGTSARMHICLCAHLHHRVGARSRTHFLLLLWEAVWLETSMISWDTGTAGFHL